MRNHCLSKFLVDATILTISSQVTMILHFFLARNIRIARARAWDQTVLSRGKGPDFWGPYVEEWDTPPVVDESRRGVVLKAFETSIGRFLFKKRALSIFNNFIGIQRLRTVMFENKFSGLISDQYLPFRGYVCFRVL